MKIAYDWLKQYLPVDPGAERISEILTNTGLEVDEEHPYESVPGGLAGLIVGEVKAVDPHPNADKLKVTRVNTGNGEDLKIICGAPNVAEGQKVIVAPVGTTLHPVSAEPFKIKKTKIRGEESRGMICAEDEIGLGEDHEGIVVLPEDARVGDPVRNYFEIHSDRIFEIDITPNRNDALSHLGVARDVHAYTKFSGEGDPSGVRYPDVEAFNPPSGEHPIAVEIQDEKACPRYSGVVLEGLKVAPSPKWLRERLASIGLPSINNVVDITNFVLHETGQPLHAFDADKIRGGKVVVGHLEEGTKFKTLDEEERTLSADDLMICDAEGGMCIAGVFGGAKSGVTEESTSVFLESACFDPSSIRRTSNRHGLSTDASFRFERGTDPNQTLYALKRAALMIAEVAGGRIASPVTDHYPKPLEPRTIDFRLDRCDTLVGMTIERDTIRTILKALDIGIKERSENVWLLTIPTYRLDVTRESDVVEELLRIYGFNRIPMAEQVHATLSYAPFPDKDKIRRQLAGLLTGNGFHEIVSNPLARSSDIEAAEAETLSTDRNVPVLNPISSELDTMRQTMLFHGLEAIAHNLNRKETDLKLFESGTVYQQKGPGQYLEGERLALFMTVRREPESWRGHDDKASFYDMKAAVRNVLMRVGLWEHAEAGPTRNEVLADGLSLSIGQDEPATELGWVREELLERFDIDQPVFYGVVDMDAIFEQIEKKPQSPYEPLSKYPPVRRDLALVVDKSTPFAEIERVVRQSEKKLLQGVDLFDVYEGKKIEEGKRSYAIKVILQDPEKTLTEDRIDKVMDKLLKKLREEVNAKLRDE